MWIYDLCTRNKYELGINMSSLVLISTNFPLSNYIILNILSITSLYVTL
jgi:hypothetical protein